MSRTPEQHDAILILGVMVCPGAAVMAARGWGELAGFAVGVLLTLLAGAIVANIDMPGGNEK